MNLLIDEQPEVLSERMACDVLSLCRNPVRVERQRRIFCGPPAPRKTSRKEAAQPRALNKKSVRPS